MLLSSALLPILGRQVLEEGDFRQLVTECMAELDDIETHAYVRLYICYGEKAATG